MASIQLRPDASHDGSGEQELRLTEAGSPAIGCWCGVNPGNAFTEIEQHFTDGDPQTLQIRASTPLADSRQYVYAADMFAIAMLSSSASTSTISKALPAYRRAYAPIRAS